jgi:hypothetical protein
VKATCAPSGLTSVVARPRPFVEPIPTLYASGIFIQMQVSWTNRTGDERVDQQTHIDPGSLRLSRTPIPAVHKFPIHLILSSVCCHRNPL